MPSETTQLEPPVLPVPEALAAEQFALVLRKLADDLTYGIDPSRFFGQGTDFAQSRPYQIGDPVRSIDWRVTARTGTVHVKEYDSTKRSGLVIVVDTSASMAVASGALSKHDAAVWIAGTLAMVGIRRRSPVSIFSGGDRAMPPPVPSLSRGTLWAQLEALRAPADGARAGESTIIDERLARIEATLAHTGTICVISDFSGAGTMQRLKRLAQRHDVVAVQMADPMETAPLRAGFVLVRGAESSAAAVASTGFVPQQHAERDESDGAASGSENVSLGSAGVRHIVISTARGGQQIVPGLRTILSARLLARGAR